MSNEYGSSDCNVGDNDHHFRQRTFIIILQILYATEGENKKPEDREEKDALPGPAAGVLPYKGHDFLQIHYRTPTNCESCNKTLWHMIHPPTALECRSKSTLRSSSFAGHVASLILSICC